MARETDHPAVTYYATAATPRKSMRKSGRGGVRKRKAVPSVLVDCLECGVSFEIDARTFDIAAERGGGFVCDACVSPIDTIVIHDDEAGGR